MKFGLAFFRTIPEARAQLDVLHVDLIQNDLLHLLHAFPFVLIGNREYNPPERLPDLQVCLHPHGADKHDDFLRPLHPLLQLPVDHRIVGNRNGGEVDGLRRITVRHRIQVPVDLFRKERREGSHQLHHRIQALLQCLVCRELITPHLALPEPPPVPPYVPVGKLVDCELADAARGFGHT